MKNPNHLFYTKEHEWADIKDNEILTSFLRSRSKLRDGAYGASLIGINNIKDVYYCVCGFVLKKKFQPIYKGCAMNWVSTYS